MLQSACDYMRRTGRGINHVKSAVFGPFEAQRLHEAIIGTDQGAIGKTFD